MNNRDAAILTYKRKKIFQSGEYVYKYFDLKKKISVIRISNLNFPRNLEGATRWLGNPQGLSPKYKSLRTFKFNDGAAYFLPNVSTKKMMLVLFTNTPLLFYERTNQPSSGATLGISPQRKTPIFKF